MQSTHKLIKIWFDIGLEKASLLLISLDLYSLFWTYFELLYFDIFQNVLNVPNCAVSWLAIYTESNLWFSPIPCLAQTKEYDQSIGLYQNKISFIFW